MNIRFVSDSHVLGDPDAVIIPGSKNVAGDLRHIRERGMDEAILAYVSRGGTVVGLCGGYQMLGRAVIDSDDLRVQVKHMRETIRVFDVVVPRIG